MTSVGDESIGVSDELTLVVTPGEERERPPDPKEEGDDDGDDGEDEDEWPEAGQHIAHFTDPPTGVTVPVAMRWVSGRTNHRCGVVLIETCDIRRAIPEAKLTAVKAVLNAWGDTSKWSMEYGGTGSAPSRDARGFRIRFNAMKSPAEVSTFLGAIETAVTT